MTQPTVSKHRRKPQFGRRDKLQFHQNHSIVLDSYNDQETELTENFTESTATRLQCHFHLARCMASAGESPLVVQV